MKHHKQHTHEKKNAILIVDSDPQLQKLMALILDPENFKIIECRKAETAVRLCMTTKPDLVLLDITQPLMDGKDIITGIREWSQIPIIILTERTGNNDVVTALNMGASDYVTRPFNAEVLLARINVSLRKAVIDETGESEIKNGPLRIDLVRHEVFLNDELLGFTPKEYDLLRFFIVHRGKMLTHKEILREVWGPAHSDDTQYLRVFVSQVRTKIEKDSCLSALIFTEPGVGYRMEIAEIASLVHTDAPSI